MAFPYKSHLLAPKELTEIGDRYDTRIKEYIEMAIQSNDLSALALEENMGYTLKTLASALWTLYYCKNFEEGLLAVVNAGGDADTNAAVACSLLGAKYGYSSIPTQYIVPKGTYGRGVKSIDRNAMMLLHT